MVITLKPNINLEINGIIDAGIYQIFDISATGSEIIGNPEIPYAVPHWWFKNGYEDYNSSSNDWTDAIQAAVDFYPRIYIPNGHYYVGSSIFLDHDKPHHIYGNGNRNILQNSTFPNTTIEATATNFDYIFKLNNHTNTNNINSKGISFEHISFICNNGIQINNDNTFFLNESGINRYVHDIKISNCFFENSINQGKGTAISFNKIFSSDISYNRIINYKQGINLRGSDLNIIHDNRIEGFYEYGILLEGLGRINSAGALGSQNLIQHNEILTFKGTDSTGAYIKSSIKQLILKDNYLENVGSGSIVKAMIDCSNNNLYVYPFIDQDNNGLNDIIEEMEALCVEEGITADCEVVKAKPSNIYIEGNRLGSKEYALYIPKTL